VASPSGARGLSCPSQEDTRSWGNTERQGEGAVGVGLMPSLPAALVLLPPAAPMPPSGKPLPIKLGGAAVEVNEGGARAWEEG